MPNNIRAILSVIVALATLLVFFLEYQAGGGALQWVALGLGIFMVAAVWLFPEAKGVKDN
jgi:phosphoglycerol transferase MdoB-like AlkP superfamily enzyme